MYKSMILSEALVRVCNEIDQSGAGGTLDDYAFIRAILQDVVVDAMFQVRLLSCMPTSALLTFIKTYFLHNSQSIF